MTFDIFNFENNGDLYGAVEPRAGLNPRWVLIGRCDTDDGTILLSDEHTDNDLSEIKKALAEIIGLSMEGEIDWTPDECWLKAAGMADDYTWERAEGKWVRVS